MTVGPSNVVYILMTKLGYALSGGVVDRGDGRRTATHQ